MTFKKAEMAKTLRNGLSIIRLFSSFKKRRSVNPILTAGFLFKLVQCQPRLNCEIQPIVVEGVCFNHTQPLHKGFGLLSLLKGHPCPQNPKKRGYFRYPQNNRPTYIFSHPRNRDFPYLRYINTPMSRISCPSNDNHEKTFFSGFSLLGQS